MTEEKKMSGIEILKAQPLIDRIIFMANHLRRLEAKNNEDAGGLIPVSRTQADEKVKSRGKALAYRDTTVFVYKLFGDEMKERLNEVKGQEKEGIE